MISKPWSSFGLGFVSIDVQYRTSDETMGLVAPKEKPDEMSAFRPLAKVFAEDLQSVWSPHFRH